MFNSLLKKVFSLLISLILFYKSLVKSGITTSAAQQGLNPLFNFFWALLFLLSPVSSSAQTKEERKTTFNLLPKEKWYGATVNEGHLMPFKAGYCLDLNGDVKGNQASPLLVSDQGRYIWSDNPFAFVLDNNAITISKNTSQIILEKPGKTLAQAYRSASKRFFPSTGTMPDSLLFSKPQYNTWIELIYNQNQQDILKYAHEIIDNGFEPGVLMIDDNWAPYYGNFEFRKDRFADAKAMVDELHALGFKVMMWICPFIRPDSEEARFLMAKKWVLMDNGGDLNLAWKDVKRPAIIEWWNGFSMVMDFTNPDALTWYQGKLDKLIRDYGVDGFKLDAGDPQFYPSNGISFKKISSNEHTELWGEFGLKYPLNEYRAMWKRGGQPLAERLRDKYHTWEDLTKLIPHITTSGLLGYAYTCPDMIGGGDYSSFIDNQKLDQDLIVRSAQCHAFMPMMQFSVAPWRILDKEHLDAVKGAVALRKKFVPYILELARKSSITGEPIVRNMEYVFPHAGFANCQDQFMLGDSILIAPILSREKTRIVTFPSGTWVGEDGKTIKGPVKRTIHVSLNQLPYYRFVKN